jgi:hypothetical protein
MTRRASLVALALLLGAVPAVAQTVTFVPPDTTFVLNPGEQQVIDVTVCLPGQLTKADVYLLADVTTSMDPVLDQLKTDASFIVNALASATSTDIALGLGSYRDFINLPFLPQPFVPQVAVTKNAATVIAGINDWVAAGGGDPPESQFYALWKLAHDPIAGFRPGAKRLVVWFGDSPGHDPICSSFVGGLGDPPIAIDEPVLTAALNAAGPGGTSVLAIGTVTSTLVYPDAINSDPGIGGFNIDYDFACSQRGSGGQAQRIADATGGSYSQITDPTEITEAIFTALSNFLTTSDISLAVSGDIAPFVKDISPPSYQDVQLPPDPTESVCVQFQVTLEGPPCGSTEAAFDGSIDVVVDRMTVATQPVHVEQPACFSPLQVLIIGPRRIDQPLPTGDPADKLLVLPALKIIVDHAMPDLPIPNNPALLGADVYLQVILRDEFHYPLDPIKTSNGLLVVIGKHNLGEPYGTGSGLSLLLDVPAVLGGLLEIDSQVVP